MKKFLLLMSFVLAIGNANAATEWLYKTVDSTELTMLVYLPDNYADSDKDFPCIVYFHGGGWNTGTPDWQSADCKYWKTRGMIAVSVDYRLKDRDNVEVPLECVKDAKSAVRYLRKNAKELKVDPDKIICAGSSAGGQLAAATAMITDTTTNDNVYDLSISCIPNALILYNPYFKCPEYLSPKDNVVEGLPPTFIFVGGKDPTVTVQDMINYHNSLIQAGNESTLFIGKEGSHGFCNGNNINNPFFYWSLEMADPFLEKHSFISGNPTVVRPDGVLPLREDEYYSYDNLVEDPGGGNETNLALNGSATQSSNHPDGGGEAYLAIDGNTNGAFGQGSVTRTDLQENPWWQVDLGSNTSIGNISVFGRSDACCNQRLADFSVFVLNANGDTTYNERYINNYPVPSLTMDAGGVDGQIIKVQQYHSNMVLNLAEVQIYEALPFVSFKVTDNETNDSIPNATLTIDSTDYTLNNHGEITIELSRSEHALTLSKKGFYSIEQSITITKDTLVTLEMDKESFSLIFQIKDAATDEYIPSVMISINDSVYETDALGSLSLVLDYGDYDYTLNKDNYNSDSGAVSLSTDTTLTLLMSVETGVNSHFTNEIEIYPNPVNQALNILLVNAGIAKCEIFNIAGELVYSDYITKGKNLIEVGDFISGIYMLRIKDKHQVITQMIVKK